MQSVERVMRVMTHVDIGATLSMVAGLVWSGEYAPQPPFDAGTPKTAPAEVHQTMGSMFDGLVAGMPTSAKAALGT